MSKGTDMALSERQKTKDSIIIQITDTHLMNDDELMFLEMSPAETFRAVIEDIQQRYPNTDVIFHTGDLAQVPVPETYKNYLAFMDQLGIPFYQVPGNHDDINFFPFYKNLNQVHAIQIGNWTVMLLNSAVKGKVYGQISDEQLHQLDQLLIKHKDQHVILTCHHHPLEMQSRWIDHHKLQNTENLTQILSKHKNVKLVLCGHVHQDSLNLWNNIHFYSTPSTCVQFKPKSEDFALDDIAAGYRVLYLKADGNFETKIHRLENKIPQINLNISGY